jgi:pimeloyl-ACP methyl ester carboxylesterase
MSAKLKYTLVLLAIAGVLGYRHLRPHVDAGTRIAHRGHASNVAPVPVRRYGKIAFTPCSLTSQAGITSVEAQCGSWSVPENPALPSGRKIVLHIAWITADDSGPVAPDPVFMLAGGPGQSATASYPQVAAAFHDVLKTRNVILLDQRGTGGSNPLDCKQPDAASETAAARDAAARTALARDFAERCRDALSSRADLRFYTTTDALRDLDSVRQAMGAKSIDLVGISYGTRVAQQYAMRYPRSTRAIVLDSIAPNTLIVGNEFARNLEQALDLQFGQCATTPACARDLGNPRTRLNALMTRLKAEPPLVRYRDPSSDAMHEERLTPERVAGLMRMYAYAPLASSLLPLQLKEASEGRYDGLMALSTMLDDQMTGQMMLGMQLSVLCSEDAFGFKSNADDAATLLGNEFADELGAQCQVWPKGAMPSDFHAPLRSPLPALLMSGEFDPVTPPRYGEAVVRGLPNGRHLIARGQGHNVIASGCMPKLLARFLETTDAKALDAKCLDTLPYTPPFTSFNGWEP